MGEKKYNKRGPGGTSRPGGRSGGAGSGPTKGGGGGGSGGYTGGKSHKGGESSCSFWAVPAVIATLVYAMPRMAWQDWKGRLSA